MIDLLQEYRGFLSLETDLSKYQCGCPAKSEEDECASPNLKLRGGSIELYNY